MHSGAAIAFRDVPAAASHGTAIWSCQGSGRVGVVAASRRPRIPCPPVRPGKQSGCRVCGSGVAEILWADGRVLEH